MDRNSIEVLKNLAGVQEELPTMDERDVIGDLEILRLDDWDKNTSSNLKPDRRLAVFQNEIESNFRHTPKSTPRFWEMKEKLYANAGMNGKETITKTIQRKLDMLSTIDEKLNYAADNARTWPTYVSQEQLLPTLIKQQEKKSKLLFDSRLNSTLSFQNMINKLSEDQVYLDPEISLESHGEDLVETFLYGYDASVSSNGRFQIPLEGANTDVWALPPSDSSVMERLIAVSDLQPLTHKLKPLLQASRDKAQEEANLVSLSKFNRLTELPKEFQIPTLVDGALLSDDPEFSTQEAVGRIMKKNINAGKYNSPQAYARDYFKIMTEITGYVESKGNTQEGDYRG